MANVSDWSANEKDNLFLDELNLSDQHGRRAAKVMAAVKAKADEVDSKLDAVAGGLVFRGVKATYADLEAVTDPAVGDMYSVTALGGENYAWTGTAWDSLGTSDADVVHKTGAETIAGVKTFSDAIRPLSGILKNGNGGTLPLCGGSSLEFASGAKMLLCGGTYATSPGAFMVDTGGEAKKSLAGSPDGTLSWDGQSIQTSSDERLKTSLAAVPDAVLDAWEEVKWGQFRYLDAVERKGESARLHLGVIAQRVKAVFEGRGLDACAYGILCHEEREAVGEDPAVDLWMVRYEEALAMEAACQRRRADRLEARLAAVEALLNGK